MNYLIPIISLIWLIIIGDWKSILFGLSFMFFSKFILALIASPNIILAFIANFTNKFNSKIIDSILLFIGSIINSLAITIVGSIVIFVFCKEKTGTILVPYILASFSIVNSIYEKEFIEDIPILVLSSYLGSLISLIYLYISSDLFTSIIIYGIINILGSVIQSLSSKREIYY